MKREKKLEEAKRLYQTANAYQRYVLERLFPELAESEDERIRKALLEYFGEECDTATINGIYCYKIYAWLEKQGETSPVLSNSSNIGKDEQKYANKVKSKFHDGDWIIYRDEGCTEILRIIGVTDTHYLCIDISDDYCRNLSINFIDSHNYHLWTIQDAKQGDVLATNSNIIFIFKFLDEGGTIAFHTSCTINNGAYFPKLKERLCDQDVYPATKEQRNMLFKKMHEAGYMWNAEEKKLKKIEQKHTWSKEDERMMNFCISRIKDELESLRNNKFAHQEILQDFKEGCWERIDWLQSLKQRIVQ